MFDEEGEGRGEAGPGDCKEFRRDRYSSRKLQHGMKFRIKSLYFD